MKSDANNYRLYYKDDATLKFTVKEANFFSEDINLYDNGKSIDFSEIGNKMVMSIQIRLP